METAIALRVLSSLIDTFPNWLSRRAQMRLLDFRARVREELLERLSQYKTEASCLTNIPSPSNLESPIIKNSENLSWIKFTPANSIGEFVVPGDFHTGPFTVMRAPSEIPIFLNDKSILVCHSLYPEIYKFFPRIKGIISENGAHTSHLSILARESNMPLLIRSNVAKKILHGGEYFNSLICKYQFSH